MNTLVGKTGEMMFLVWGTHQPFSRKKTNETEMELHLEIFGDGEKIHSRDEFGRGGERTPFKSEISLISTGGSGNGLAASKKILAGKNYWNLDHLPHR